MFNVLFCLQKKHVDIEMCYVHIPLIVSKLAFQVYFFYPHVFDVFLFVFVFGVLSLTCEWRSVATGISLSVILLKNSCIFLTAEWDLLKGCSSRWFCFFVFFNY